MIGGRKIGFFPNGSYGKLSMERICESLRRIGYDAVELSLAFASPQNHPTDALRRMVDVIHGFGMEVSEAVVQQDLLRGDELAGMESLEFTKRCMRAYAEAGIGTVNLFTGPVPWNSVPLVVGAGIGEGEAWGRIFRAFDALLPVAEETGVAMAVENVFGMLCHDFFTLRYLIDRYRSPLLGVNYDPSHDILAGHTDIGWIIRQWGAGNIKHVHLKDAVGRGVMGQFLFPLPGEGNVDWKAFSAAMDDIGYAGVMSVEFESFAYASRIFKGDWEKAAQISFDNFKLLFEP